MSVVIRIFKSRDDRLIRTDKSGKFRLTQSGGSSCVINQLRNFQPNFALFDFVTQQSIVANDNSVQYIQRVRRLPRLPGQ